MQRRALKKSTFVYMVFIVVCALPSNPCVVTFAMEDGCEVADEAAHNYTCNFEKDSCGWSNIQNNDANWTIANHETPRMSVTMDGPANMSATLQTPSICASSNYWYSVEFKYRLESGRTAASCNLSLGIVVDGNKSVTWTNSTVVLHPLGTVSRNLPSINRSFKIFFEARKYADVRCQIDVDDVVITLEKIVTLITPPLGNETVQTADSSPQTTIPASEQVTSTGESADSLSAGAVAGIVVGILVITASTVALFLFITRRSRKKAASSPKNMKSPNETTTEDRSVANKENDNLPVTTNAPIMLGVKQPDNQHTKNQRDDYSTPAEALRNGRALPGGSDYATVDSSNDYSMPGDALDSMRAGNAGYHLSTVTEHDDGYSVAMDVDAKQPRGNKTKDEYSKVNKPKKGNYNKLSFQNPHLGPNANKSSADTYNHIEDQESTSNAVIDQGKASVDTYNHTHEPISQRKATDDAYSHIHEQDHVYKVPRSDGIDYSLARIPEDSGPVTSATLDDPGYTVVNSKGNPPASRQAEYNHLNLKEKHSLDTPSSSGSAGGQGAGVYNRLGQSEDTYNRINSDGRSKGRDGGDYNHISDF